MGQNICCPLSTKYSYNLSIVFFWGGGGLVRSCFGGGWSELMCDNLGKTDGFIRSLLHSCHLHNPQTKSSWPNCCVRRGLFLHSYTCSSQKSFYELLMHGHVLRWLTHKETFQNKIKPEVS